MSKSEISKRGSMATTIQDRLRQLDKIENEIGNCLQNAGLALQELSKEKPAVNNVTSHTTNFLKTLQGIENGMAMQINYLTQSSTGNPHEGSTYGSQKDYHMAMHRKQHVISRLDELEKIRIDHLKRRQSQGQGHPHGQGQSHVATNYKFS